MNRKWEERVPNPSKSRLFQVGPRRERVGDRAPCLLPGPCAQAPFPAVGLEVEGAWEGWSSGLGLLPTVWGQGNVDWGPGSPGWL